jgi:general secretion pathway protein L
MAEAVLLQPWLRVKRAFAGSAIARFFAWWLGELRQWVPAGLRDAVVDRRDVLRVALAPEGITIARAADAEPELVVPTELDAPVQQTEIARHLARYEVRPKLVYVLPAARLLARRLTLPLAAEENLRQVLGFELDRQTPFRADQVYFDQRIAARDPIAKQMQVELAITTRAALDADLDRLAAAGVELDAVDGPAPNGELLGMNLAPPERRAQRRDLRLRLNLALAAGVIVLLGVVMAQSLSNREEALEKLSREVEKAKRDAHAVAELRRTLIDTVEGANFLNDRRQSKPVVIELMRDINQRLPDDTYLQRFTLTNAEVQIQGLSSDASKLVPLLQQSELIEAPAVEGAIMPDATKKKEMFVIKAKPKVKTPGKPAAPKSEEAADGADAKS